MLTLVGRLGRAAAPLLDQALRASVVHPNRHLVIDLSGIDYISSAGIAVLEDAVARIRAGDGAVVVAGAPEAVRLTLSLSGILEKVRVEATRDDALRFLNTN